MNLNLLPVLDALLAERNVSKAGARLGLSQPAVSNALAQLRGVLGDPLLVRGPKGMVPTERALALAGPLRAALQSLSTGLDPPTGFDPRTAERGFTILTNDFVALAMLSRLLARLQHEAPGVHLQVRAWQEHRIAPDLERGEADLQVGFFRRLPPGHQAEELFEDRLVCVVRKDHPLVKDKKTMPLATYTKLQHVLVSHQPDGRGVVDDALAALRLSRTIALRVSHFLLVPSIISSTDYVAALSELVARSFAAVWPLQMYKLPVDVNTANVHMLWHERTNGSAAHAWLRKVVQEVGTGVEESCKKVLQVSSLDP